MLVFISLLVYVIGPIAVLVWAFRRYRQGVRPTVREWIVVAIAVLLMLLFAFSSNWDTTDRDQAEAALVISELTQRYDFPVKAKFQDRPAVDAVAQPRRVEIHIYGVSSQAEQEKILFILSKLRQQYSSRPLVVHFMREEVWEENPDGTRQPRRDREELLRKARID